MRDVTGRAVLPNQALTQAGLMRTRRVADRFYPDFHRSRAFAMVDHEIAHVYIGRPADTAAIREVLANVPGVGKVLDDVAIARCGLDHPNTGELVLVADEGHWFAYPWWAQAFRAPDYACHVDIHSKPGFDPCELFFGRWPPMSVSPNPSRIGGSHGKAGPDRRVLCAATFDLPAQPDSLVELAAAVRDWLDES